MKLADAFPAGLVLTGLGNLRVEVLARPKVTITSITDQSIRIGLPVHWSAVTQPPTAG
jgi:hypothetical protein